MKHFGKSNEKEMESIAKSRLRRFSLFGSVLLPILLGCHSAQVQWADTDYRELALIGYANGQPFIAAYIDTTGAVWRNPGEAKPIMPANEFMEHCSRTFHKHRYGIIDLVDCMEHWVTYIAVFDSNLNIIDIRFMQKSNQPEIIQKYRPAIEATLRSTQGMWTTDGSHKELYVYFGRFKLL